MLSLEKHQTREISSSYSADVPDAMAVVERQVLPKYTQKNRLRHAVQKSRREIHRQNVRFSVSSEEKK